MKYYSSPLAKRCTFGFERGPTRHAGLSKATPARDHDGYEYVVPKFDRACACTCALSLFLSLSRRRRLHRHCVTVHCSECAPSKFAAAEASVDDGGRGASSASLSLSLVCVLGSDLELIGAAKFRRSGLAGWRMAGRRARASERVLSGDRLDRRTIFHSARARRSRF